MKLLFVFSKFYFAFVFIIWIGVFHHLRRVTITIWNMPIQNILLREWVETSIAIRNFYGGISFYHMRNATCLSSKYSDVCLLLLHSTTTGLHDAGVDARGCNIPHKILAHRVIVH